MKNLFVKLYDFDEHQVLVRTGVNHADDTSLLITTVKLNNMWLEIAIGFKKEEDMESAFREYTRNDAAQFLHSSLNTEK